MQLNLDHLEKQQTKFKQLPQLGNSVKNSQNALKVKRSHQPSSRESELKEKEEVKPELVGEGISI